MKTGDKYIIKYQYKDIIYVKKYLNSAGSPVNLLKVKNLSANISFRRGASGELFDRIVIFCYFCQY
jgi:hypothetical protein